MKLTQSSKLKIQRYIAKRYLSFAFCLLIFALSSTAFASYISLNTSLGTKVTEKELDVYVSVVNKGDEPAHNVQAEIRLAGKKYYGKKVSQLGIDQKYQVMRELPLKVKRPGNYPLILAMHYTDANQYPFSALTGKTFSYKSGDRPSEIFGRMGAVTFWKTGRIKLILRNSSDTELKVFTYLETPREISVTSPKQALVIPALSERSLSFDLKNFSALSGSNYQIFAVSEYNKAGIHQTCITPGMVKIVEKKAIAGIGYNYLVFALIILVLAFVFYQFVLPIFKK